jgi:hypothetical protein
MHRVFVLGFSATFPLVGILAMACTDDSDRTADAGSGGAASAVGGSAGVGGSGGNANSGGNSASGGTSGSGGNASSGGTSGSGGNASSGGNSGSGGNASSGGNSGSGGNASSGGNAGSGGNSGSGGAISPAGPPPVELGETTNLAAAGSYVLLAKTGITNVTGTAITGGHVGVSPAAASYITGFSLIADSTTVFSTSPSVVPPGRVFASDYASPTPANLTTAVLGMEAAYADAAARTNPDVLNLGSGNIGGQTLAPGLYTWGSAVTVPSDVTVAGGASDVWIFQIANDLDVSAAKKVILAGGAQAKNIFWQVAGQATIHANAHFEGIILSKTSITLQTTASMRGRALAQALVALDNNAITAP